MPTLFFLKGLSFLYKIQHVFMMDKLSINAIQSGMKTSRLGRRIILLDMAASTNDAAWGYVGQPDCDGLCVLAEQQTAGRGRRGRIWHSQFGQSILCSLLISASNYSPSLLTLAVPVAVAESIAAICRLDAAVKWPNDVLLDGKKVAGILIESKKDAVVVGIGINVHQGVEFFEAQPMDAPATSLDIESGRRTDRNEFVRTLLEQLEYWLDQTAWAKPTLPENSEIRSTKSETNLKFKSSNDPNNLWEADDAGGSYPKNVVDEWKRRNRQIGTRLLLESDGQIYCGTCLGIDPADGLIVQLDSGAIRVFSPATTTLIKNPAQD